MNGAGLLRGAVTAAVVYGVSLGILLLPSQALDPLEDRSAIYGLLVVASLVAAAAGAAAGAWQARAGGVRAPGAGLAVAALVAAVVGLLLNADPGTDDTGRTLVFLAQPLGALLGALVYGRRWLGAVR